MIPSSAPPIFSLPRPNGHPEIASDILIFDISDEWDTGTEGDRRLIRKTILWAAHQAPEPGRSEASKDVLIGNGFLLANRVIALPLLVFIDVALCRRVTEFGLRLPLALPLAQALPWTQTEAYLTNAPMAFHPARRPAGRH